MEARSQMCEQEILTARPEAGHKGAGLLALPKRIPAKMKSSETRCLLGGKGVWCVWVDTQASSARGLLSRPLVGIEITYGGISSGFPLTTCFDLPGLQPMFGVSQDPPICAQTSLSQDRSSHKSLCIAWH